METMSTEFTFVLVFLLTLRMDWAYRYDMDLQTCVDNFDVERDKIIRTVESTSRGAVNIGFKDVSSREECLRICCETDLCDVFVFEEKMPGTCYTFHCGPPSETKCRFSKHRNYTVGMLAVDRSLSEQENQMKREQDLVSLRQGVESASSATTQTASIPVFPAANNIVSSTTMSPSLAVAPVQQSQQQEVAPNLKLQQSGTNLEQTHALVPHAQEAGQPGRRCSRFQFECRSTSECIAIYNACDGIPQCPDGSDEAPECPTTALAAAQQAGIVTAAQQTALAQAPQSQQQAQVAAQANSQPHQVAPPNEWLVRGAPQQILESADRHQIGQQQSVAGSHHNPTELQQQQHEEMLHQQLIQQRVAPQQQQAQLLQQQQQQQQQLLQQQLGQQQIHPRQRPLEEVKSLLGAENRAYGSRTEADRTRHLIPHSGTSMQGKEMAWAGQDSSHGSLSYQAQPQQQPKQLEQPPQVRNHQQGVLADSVRPVVRQQQPARANVAPNYYTSPVADNQQRQPGQESARPIAPAGRVPYGSDYYYEDNGLQYNKMGVQTYANQGQATAPQKNLVSGARLQADLASVSYDNRPRISPIENGSPQYIQQQPVPERPPGLSPLEQNSVQQIVPVQTQSQQVVPAPPHQPAPAPPSNPNQTPPVSPPIVQPSAPVESHASAKKEPVISTYAKERLPEVNLAADALVADGETSTPRGAVISLSLGLSITGIMLALVGCRMRDVKRRLLRRSGKGSFVHEADADFLVNGMYL